jgi:L-ribulokinase
MFAAVASGAYSDIRAAAAAMAHVTPQSYRPHPAAHAIYERLYAEYVRLHDYFGRGENPVMKTLMAIRDCARGPDTV